jgi:hypothetical protein
MRGIIRQQQNASKFKDNFYDTIAPEILSVANVVDAIGACPHGIMTMINPTKSNEKALGHQLFQKEVQYG